MLNCNWILNFFADEFLVVALPRTLVLCNRRLGIFYKSLQLFVLFMAAVYSVYSGIFFQHNLVNEWGVNVLHVQNPVQVAAMGTRVGPQCDNPAVYAYEGDPTFSYAPKSCKALPNEESKRMHGDKLFVPTFVDEETVWDKCGANVSEVCKGYNSKAVYNKANGRCACTFNEQFLVQNADEQHIRLVYGYEVDVSGGKRSDLRHGGIVSSMASSGASHQMKERESSLVTHFFSPDGSECLFGGGSLWQHADAVGGITGTLNELLACAGVTLDSDPATLAAGTFVAPPHLRTMGFKLQLHLHIDEDAFFRLKCEVRVVAIPVTIALLDNSNARPSVIPEIGASTRRTRRVHGVVIDVHMTGSIKTFSWSQVVRGFVDITVVLTVPSIIVQFVAMYLMGIVSEVYRHTARTKLNLFAKFNTTVAKLMLAEVAFRGLVGKWDGRARDLGSLTPAMFLQRLEDIFEENCDNGVLEQEELMKMASVVFTSMDTSANGHIGCSEFVQACTNDGEISLQRMANFFDDQHQRGFIRRLFDNTDTVASSTADKSMQGLSFRSTNTFESKGSSDGDAVVVFNGSVSEVSDSMVNTKMPSTSREEMKDVPPSILASHIIDNLAAHEMTLMRLTDQMQELEQYCNRAVDGLRILVEPRQMSAWQVRHNSACASLSSSRGTSNSNRIGVADDGAACPLPAPDQPHYCGSHCPCRLQRETTHGGKRGILAKSSPRGSEASNRFGSCPDDSTVSHGQAVGTAAEASSAGPQYRIVQVIP